MLDTLAVANYRCLRRLVVPLRGVTVVTGPNGSGKSSLYRSLRLLADSARNGAVSALANEGGLASTMWAGPGRQGPVSLKLGFAGQEFGYAVDLGLPQDGNTFFGLDPEIKTEAVWAGPVLRPSALIAERAGPTARIRGLDDGWRTVAGGLRPFDSMVSELADPQAAPELLVLRERMRSWRFYDHVRTDAAAPARAPRIGTRTTVLSHDGADLAAAVQTIAEIGDAAALVPARVLSESSKSMTAGEKISLSLATVEAGDGLIGFEGEGGNGVRQITTRLLDGEFPKVRHLMNVQPTLTVRANTSEVVAAVKRVALVAERNTSLRMMIEADHLTFEAATGDQAQAVEAVEASVVDETGNGLAMNAAGFNPHYLLDALNALDTPYVNFAFTAPGKPCLLTPLVEIDGTPLTDYKHVIMLMRLPQ